MSTSAISSISNSDYTSATRETGSELGMNEFLELLSAQLANQDPLEPMEDTEFIAQLAQFSSLEAMSEMSAAFIKTQAYSLVGKSIFAQTNIDGVTTQLEGVVSGVVSQEGEDYLQVGEYLVPLDGVLAVYDTSSANNAVLQGAALVGKDVEAVIPAPTEDNPSASETITGTVESVSISSGQLFAKVGDTEVPLAYIYKIS